MNRALRRRQGKLAKNNRPIPGQPQSPEMLVRLAMACQADGNQGEAEACYERAIALRPDYFEALFHLGNLFMMLGRFAEAAQRYRRALQINPRSVEVLANLGSAYLKRGQWEDAHLSFLRALEIRPFEPGILTNLATVQHKMGHGDQAMATYDCVLSLVPDFPDALLNRGHVAHEWNRLDEAEASYRRALVVRPDFPEAMTGLGIVAHKRGQFDLALGWFHSALQRNPNLATAHYNASLTRLLTGDLAAGWAQYEWRWLTEEMPPHGFMQPLWGGDVVTGQTILLHCEQGFGDSIQLIRYAPVVQVLGMRVAVFCPPPLKRLFATVRGIDHLASASPELPPCHYQAPLMSLPYLLGSTLASIPCNTPYLFSEEAKKEYFRELLAPIVGLKVGLAWSGNPRHINDRNRSMDPEIMARLCALSKINFISLQKELSAREQAIFSKNANFFDFCRQLEDFADTAALVSQLDLVICVDTAVAHLAGAMAKPGWVLLPKIADWRWLLDRDDSPWYPSLRVFRQSDDGDWHTVISQVMSVLIHFSL
ncbi:MAG: tetratricopeptide repeat protein [Magnetococcus sp. THC-1_WYH]